jgi:hypothetical protein
LRFCWPDGLATRCRPDCSWGFTHRHSPFSIDPMFRLI